MTQMRRFPAEPGSVAAARRFATGLLAALPGETLDAVELMVSELATNSIRHAMAAFEVRITRRGSEVRVEVTDDAGGTPAKRTPEVTDPRGRGLQIVELFSDGWGVTRRQGDGKTVWFVISGAPAVSRT